MTYITRGILQGTIGSKWWSSLRALAMLALALLFGCSSSRGGGEGGSSGEGGTAGGGGQGGSGAAAGATAGSSGAGSGGEAGVTAGSGGAGSGGTGGSGGAEAGAGGAGTSGADGAGTGGTAGSAGAPPFSGQANVVMILTDDLDRVSIERLVDRGMMPNLKQHVIDQGVTFGQSFATNAVCCPSRATFLSGQYSHNHGALSNASGHQSFVPHDDNTVATRLHDAGYRTAHVGKYLNGYSDRNYVAPGWDEWHTTLDGSTYNLYEYELIESIDGSAPVGTKPGTYQTDELAARAAGFIRNSGSQPFFVAITPLAPHVEVLPGQRFDTFRTMYKLRIRPAPRHLGSLRAPDGGGGYIEDQALDADFDLPGRDLASFNEADLSDKPSWLKNGPNGTEGAWPLLDAEYITDLTIQHLDRIESMLAVDDMIGELFDALSESGKLDETLVIFTSDNGFFLGEHRLNNKMFPYEEGLRVPLYIRPPGGVSPRAEQRIALNNDWAPTIVDYAGVLEGWEVDGRSLRPLLQGESPSSWRKRFLVEHWFLRVNADGSLQYNDLPDYMAVRAGVDHGETSNQIYIEYTSSASPPVYDHSTSVFEVEHYDLDVDPYQVLSVAGDPSYDGSRAELQPLLNALTACAGQQCRDAEDL